MNSHYDHPPRCTAAGVITASILVASLAMGASLLWDQAPPSGSTGETATQPVPTANG